MTSVSRSAASTYDLSIGAIPKGLVIRRRKEPQDEKMLREEIRFDVLNRVAIAKDGNRGLTVRQDVDGLIVDVEKATEALADGHERPVAGEDVRIELEVPRHVAPSSQQQDLGRRLRMRRLGGHPLVLTPRSVRVGVLLVRRARHRRRMARSLVVPERRRATANARCPLIRGRGIGPASGRGGGTRSPPGAVRELSTAATSPLQRRARRWNPRPPARRQQPSSARDSASLTVPSPRQPHRSHHSGG